MLSRPSGISFKSAVYLTTPFGASLGNSGLIWERAESLDVDGDGSAEIVIATTPTSSLNRPISGSRIVVIDFKDGKVVPVTSKVLPTSAKASVVRDFVIGDFNGDGKNDVLFSTHGPHTETWPFPGEQNRLFLSTGALKYVDATKALPKATDYSLGSVTADFNGDGKLDIFVNNQTENDNTPGYLLFGDGKGGFGSPAYMHSRDGGWTRSARFSSDFDGLSAPYTTAVIDYKGDGIPDLYLGPVSRSFGGTPIFAGYGIAVNDGKGHFTLKLDPAFKPPIAAAKVASGATRNAMNKTGDIDNDGDADLLVFWDGTGQDLIQLLLNRGKSGFLDVSDRIEGQAGGKFLPAVAGTPDIDLVDLDGDGDLDIVMSRWTEDFKSQRSLWFENDGTGHFARISPKTFPVTQAFKIADVNGDGIPDIAFMPDTWKLPFFTDVNDKYVGVRLGQITTAVNRTGWKTNDSIAGGDGNDTLSGGAGHDVLRSNAGSDRLLGGSGDDLLLSGSGDDTLKGGSGNDTLRGAEGNDILMGEAGNDRLEDGAGADTIFGGAGNDTILAGDGADAIYGGDGVDILVFATSAAVTIDLAVTVAQDTGAGGLDLIKDVESVSGDGGADLLFGNAAANGLDGRAGHDRLYGRAGNDSLIGQTGNDTLSGGSGNDWLYGGSGRDTLMLGAGRDVLVFKSVKDSTVAAPDLVTDFVRGQDKIDLTAIDADTTKAGNQAFLFKGSAFTGTAGEVIFAAGKVSGDVNGDKIADFAIDLASVKVLGASDFYL